MKKQVWVVKEQYPYEIDNIRSICDSEELAKQKKNHLEKTEGGLYSSTFYITPYDLNEDYHS